jgi:hypothetical protein
MLIQSNYIRQQRKFISPNDELWRGALATLNRSGLLNEAAVRQLFKVWFVLRWSFLAECPDD